MGLLKDRDYWGRVLTRVEGMRPLPGQVMPRENAFTVIREACRAFSDLVQDPDLDMDLEDAIRFGQRSQNKMPRADQAFRQYVDQFRRIEREALTQSGVSEEAIVDIEKELSELVRLNNEHDFHRVRDKIRRIQEVCCTQAADQTYLNGPHRELAEDVLNAIKGIGIVGVDVGTMHHWNPIVGDLIGTSIGAGLAKFRPLLKRIW